MTATCTLPADATFRWCAVCAAPGRLHIGGVCQMCTLYPRRCTWASACSRPASAAARSPYRHQMGSEPALVCEEHARVARLAGWEVGP